MKRSRIVLLSILGVIVVAVVVGVLVLASTAYAVVTGSFSGKTGQKQSISFHVGHGKVTNLDFHIRDKCPSGHI